MKSILLLVIFTIPFLMVNIEKKIKLLLISIFILPFFYSFFGILPNGVKLITDIYLLLFLFEIIFNRKLTRVIKYNKLTKFTFIYIVLFSLIFVLSSIANGSNILLSLLEYRKIIFPLLFLFVLNYYSILKNRIYDFEPFLKLIFLIQFILIPLQYIFYDMYKGFMVTHMSKIDCASGTFGIGTSMVGIFIISYFMYIYIISKNNPKTFFYLLPLAFVFSGGANSILVGAFSLNFVIEKNNIRKISKIILGIFLFVVLIQIVSINFMEDDLLSYSYNYISRAFENNTSSEASTIADNQKLNRFLGPAYADYQLRKSNKLWLGFGNDVYATSTVLNVRKNKFRLNEVINLVPEIMMKYGYVGLLINLYFYIFLLIYFFTKRRQNDYFKISFILAVIMLISFMYTKPIYQSIYLSFLFFIYFKAEMLQGDNKCQKLQ